MREPNIDGTQVRGRLGCPTLISIAWRRRYETRTTIKNPGVLACFFTHTSRLRRTSKTPAQLHVFSHTREEIGGQLLEIRAPRKLPQVTHNKNLNDDSSGSSLGRIDPFRKETNRQPSKLLRASAKGDVAPTVALLRWRGIVPG